MLTERPALLRRATHLAWFTVGWNIIEGLVAISAAVVAGSQALLGFGLDSGVESLSASVVLWRLYAERRDPERAEAVERRALRLIGVTFFVLAAFIAVDSIRALVGQHEPDASVVGIVLTSLSLLVMRWLARGKRQVGIAMAAGPLRPTARRPQRACICRRSCSWVSCSTPRSVGGGPIRWLRLVSWCSWCAKGEKRSTPSTQTTAAPDPLRTQIGVRY